MNMGRNTYQTCEMIMDEILAQGFKSEVSLTILLSIVKRVAGMDPKTTYKYPHALGELGFIKPTSSGVFKILYAKKSGVQRSLKGGGKKP